MKDHLILSVPSDNHTWSPAHPISAWPVMTNMVYPYYTVDWASIGHAYLAPPNPTCAYQYAQYQQVEMGLGYAACPSLGEMGHGLVPGPITGWC